MSAQSWALVRGTMARSPKGNSDPWLQVYANNPAVGNVMGWPREVLPVFQEPLCSLPTLAVAVVLDVGTCWLYDRQLRRAIPAVTERRSMAVLVRSKQLARVRGKDAQGHVTEAMFSLPGGDDHVAADACHTLDTAGPAAVNEARAGGQRLVLASDRGPGAIRGRCHRRGLTGLRLGALGAWHTQPQSCAVAPADCRPASDARRATDTPPGVHVGGSEAQPTQLCHSTHAGGCFARTPGRVLRYMAGPVVAVL